MGGGGTTKYVLVAAGGGGGGWNKSDNNETAKKIRDASTEESGQNSADGKAGGQHRCFWFKNIRSILLTYKQQDETLSILGPEII